MEFFYIFNVPSGHRFHVEVSLHWKVRELQECIVQVTGINVDDQVLLKHNGDIIDGQETISDCCPGNTADAPVFLFQRSSKHDKEDNRLWDQEINEITSIIDVSIENANQIEQDSDVQRIYLDIPHRARECCSASRSAVHACARIAEEHRLMLRGWVALVNNMDSSVASLRKRASRFLQQMEKVHHQKPKATDLLQNFDEVIDQLKRIRLPGTLLAHSRGNVEPSSFSDTSLYAWISASDPEHSLKELVDQVSEQFGNFEQMDAKMVVQNIEKVMDLSRNVNCREIKGINIRLSYLDHHLQNAEDRGKTIEKHASKILDTPSRIDQSSLEELVSQYRYLMRQIYTELKEIRLICNRFFQSKLEFLRILRIRLNSWIVRTYNRLHHAHSELQVYEEKCTGLKQRLDLLRQIKEAPIMYATAVTENVRRKVFQKEFNSWYSIHVDKCTALYDEESKLRAQFSAKMEKHFLRVLFHGMFDTIPLFFVKSLSKFDTTLGPIDVEYLRELRKNIEELKQYLNVSVPQVFLRLEVRDPQTPSPAVSQGGIRREESFVTTGAASSLPVLSSNFPSTNWLSTDDVNDASPSTTPSLLMTKSPPSRFGSLSSFNMPIAPSLNQLSMLGEEDELPFTSSSTPLARTAPIQIPASQPQQLSEKSSHFSTPDDHFHTADSIEDRQFVIDDLTSRSQLSQEFLKHVAAQIVSISKGMLELRADVSTNSHIFVKEFSKLEEVTCNLVNYHNTKTKNFYDAKLAEVRKEHEDVVATLRKKDAEIKELRRKCEASSRELAEKAVEIKRLQSEVDALKAKAEDAKSKAFVEETAAKLEKGLMNTGMKELTEGTLEPSTRKKSQRREEGSAATRHELDYERKFFQQKINFSMRWLAAERKRLRGCTVSRAAERHTAGELIDNNEKASSILEREAGSRNSVATQTESATIGGGNVESDKGRIYDMKESISTQELVHVSECGSTVAAIDRSVCKGNKRSDSYVQTTIGLRTMDRMVAVEDIIEGSTVLVIWNDRHNAYMLFSSSAYNHFVKESSVRRLGLATILPSIPRRNWILGKVSHLDLCVIRKADNRYHLPVETRVYRVDVEPLDVAPTHAAGL